MEQNGTTFGGLSQKQATALPHLLKPGSLADQARNAGIGRTTLHRWLRDDNFRRSLEQLREDALRLAESELQAMSYRAAAVIREALHDEDPDIKFRAAQAALRHAHKAQYGQQLERRVELLMDAFDLRKETAWPR